MKRKLSFLLMCILLVGCKNSNGFPMEEKSSYKERISIYNSCFDASHTYKETLSCIQIYEYLRGH